MQGYSANFDKKGIAVDIIHTSFLYVYTSYAEMAFYFISNIAFVIFSYQIYTKYKVKK